MSRPRLRIPDPTAAIVATGVVRSLNLTRDIAPGGVGDRIKSLHLGRAGRLGSNSSIRIILRRLSITLTKQPAVRIKSLGVLFIHGTLPPVMMSTGTTFLCFRILIGLNSIHDSKRRIIHETSTSNLP